MQPLGNGKWRRRKHWQQIVNWKTCASEANLLHFKTAPSQNCKIYWRFALSACQLHDRHAAFCARALCHSMLMNMVVQQVNANGVVVCAAAGSSAAGNQAPAVTTATGRSTAPVTDGIPERGRGGQPLCCLLGAAPRHPPQLRAPDVRVLLRPSAALPNLSDHNHSSQQSVRMTAASECVG